jgi:hypothetical protein
MIKYLVIDIYDNFNYIVDDLDSLIKEMYEVELLNGKSKDEVKEYFNSSHKIFEIKGEIKELIGGHN